VGDDLGDLLLDWREGVPAGAHLILGHIVWQPRERALPGDDIGGLGLG